MRSRTTRGQPLPIDPLGWENILAPLKTTELKLYDDDPAGFGGAWRTFGADEKVKSTVHCASRCAGSFESNAGIWSRRRSGICIVVSWLQEEAEAEEEEGEGERRWNEKPVTCHLQPHTVFFGGLRVSLSLGLASAEE